MIRLGMIFMICSSFFEYGGQVCMISNYKHATKEIPGQDEWDDMFWVVGACSEENRYVGLAFIHVWCVFCPETIEGPDGEGSLNIRALV